MFDSKLSKILRRYIMNIFSSPVDVTYMTFSSTININYILVLNDKFELSVLLQSKKNEKAEEHNIDRATR